MRQSIRGLRYLRALGRTILLDSGFRAIVLAGVLLLVAGFVHVGVWGVYGGSLAGPVSWRKPILFCFASGVTCLLIAWVYRRFRRVNADDWFAWFLATAIVAEVGLIAMQQWRGVPSHFKDTTDFDAWVLAGIKVLVAVVSVAVAYFCIRSLGPLRLTRDYAASARGGMVLLVVGCMLGFVIEAKGERLARDGLSPSVYGEAGVLKFPHGMPLHALQYLPATVWGLERMGVPLRRRLVSVRSMTVGIFGLTLFALVQSSSGRARFDLSGWSAVIFAASVALFLPAVSYATLAVAGERRDPRRGSMPAASEQQRGSESRSERDRPKAGTAL